MEADEAMVEEELLTCSPAVPETRRRTREVAKTPGNNNKQQWNLACGKGGRPLLPWRSQDRPSRLPSQSPRNHPLPHELENYEHSYPMSSK